MRSRNLTSNLIQQSLKCRPCKVHKATIYLMHQFVGDNSNNPLFPARWRLYPVPHQICFSINYQSPILCSPRGVFRNSDLIYKTLENPVNNARSVPASQEFQIMATQLVIQDRLFREDRDADIQGPIVKPTVSPLSSTISKVQQSCSLNSAITRIRAGPDASWCTCLASIVVAFVLKWCFWLLWWCTPGQFRCTSIITVRTTMATATSALSTGLGSLYYGLDGKRSTYLAIHSIHTKCLRQS